MTRPPELERWSAEALASITAMSREKRAPALRDSEAMRGEPHREVYPCQPADDGVDACACSLIRASVRGADGLAAWMRVRGRPLSQQLIECAEDVFLQESEQRS